VNYARAAVVSSLLSLASGCAPDRLEAVELAPNTLSQGLLAHWAFDDTQGLIARDDSGNQRPGTVNNGVWISNGRFGGALHLANGAYVSVPNFPYVAGQFTVSAWVRLASYAQMPATDSRWTTVVSTEAMGGWEVNVDHMLPEPSLHFGFWKGPTQGDYIGLSCPGAELGVWTQIAGVVDSTQAQTVSTVFINGLSCGADTIPNKIVAGSTTLTIGEWPFGGRFLAGDVDDISVWDRALVPSEIELLTKIPPVIAGAP